MSRIRGMGRLRSRLASLPRALETAIVPAALGVAMAPILSEARAEAPVKTGGLRRGIRLKRGRARGGKVTFRVVVDRSTLSRFYAAFEDLGTGEIRAKHFMGRAADGLRERGDVARALIRRGIERHLSL